MSIIQTENYTLTIANDKGEAILAVEIPPVQLRDIPAILAAIANSVPVPKPVRAPRSDKGTQRPRHPGNDAGAPALPLTGGNGAATTEKKQ